MSLPSGGIVAHPWRRFWARQIDYILFEPVLAILLYLAVPRIFDLWPEAKFTINYLIAQAILSALWVVPEALLVSSIRTTPGKWLLGIVVRDANGGSLSFADAFTRSAKVWIFGCACGFYPIALVAFQRAYHRLQNGGTTSWDSRTDLRYLPLRKATLVATAVLVVSSNVALVIGDYASTSALELEVQAVAKEVTNYYDDHGLKIESLSPTQMTQLRDGEVQESKERLERGGSVVIIGGCDQDCSDLDLIVFDPEGNEIGRDREANARPWIWLEPQLTGEYRIVATMQSCAADDCMSGYRVLRSASALPADSEGTGFVVDANGAILTADHLIEGAGSITVVFSDGSEGHAMVERRSKANDIALLRVEANTPTYLPLATPRSMRVGDRVFIVGFPLTDRLGDEIKFTEGSVTALSGAEGESAQFQMSVPIQPGSSGSPVVGLDGHVVGIATSSASDQALFDEIGTVPQLVNWATKAEIALALVGQQDHAWSASSADEARSRARNATVRVLAYSGPHE